jgi:hypothetical protein
MSVILGPFGGGGGGSGGKYDFRISAPEFADVILIQDRRIWTDLYRTLMWLVCLPAAGARHCLVASRTWFRPVS